MRAQKERLRAPPPGCGALRLEPVARLYFALPLAVRPPLRDFSPLPILRLTLFFLAMFTGAFLSHYFFLVPLAPLPFLGGLPFVVPYVPLPIGIISLLYF